MKDNQTIYVVDFSKKVTLELCRSSANYIIGDGNIIGVEAPILGEIMTAAVQLRAKGHEEGLKVGMVKGLEKGRKQTKFETAIQALKEGAEVHFVSRTTGLPVELVIKLQAKHTPH